MTQSRTERRRRVAHVSLGLDIGGLERLLVEFARRADRGRFDLIFVSITDRGKLADNLEAAGWPVVALDMPPGLRPQIALRLAKLFRERECAVVHTHDDKPLVYGSLAVRLARVRRHVHTQHHGVLPQMTARQGKLVAWAGRLPHAFVCVSRSSAAAMTDLGLSPDRISVIWNGIDLDKYPYAVPKPEGPAVTVARLNPEKDLASLLRATAVVVQSLSRFRLEIAGDGPERTALEQLAGSLGLRDHVRFLGEIHDVPSLLARASMFLLSSRTEGVSLTILEAMARGLPVVATSVGGNPEVVAHETTGILVPVGDPDALATQVLWLARHPHIGEAMGRAGRSAWKRFSIVAAWLPTTSAFIWGRRLPSTMPTKNLRAVIVDGDVSYPPTSGKRLRTLHLMQRLAARHQVTYIARCQTPDAANPETIAYFRDHHVEPILVAAPLPKKKGFPFYARLAANVVSPWPYSVTSHQSRAMRQAVSAHAANHKVDLWQFEWSGYLPIMTQRHPRSQAADRSQRRYAHLAALS